MICFVLSQPKQLSQGEPKDSKPRSWSWEFNHVTALMIVRIYYRGLDLDPEVFAATAPRVVEVPGTKPVNMRKAAGLETAELSVDDRRAMLKEVIDHTAVLKEFEGVIPEEELAKRKRALYAALPPVPPPVAKKAKVAAEDKEEEV